MKNVYNDQAIIAKILSPDLYYYIYYASIELKGAHRFFFSSKFYHFIRANIT